MESFVGIILFALAGFVSAAFYTPLKFVKWRWELMWIFYSVFALIVSPMVIASIAMPSCWEAIGQVESRVLFMTFLFGAMWGVGGLTFGLSMRYLGIGLGTAVALGFCSIVGTLIPFFKAENFMETATSASGMTVLGGVALCAIGIGINGFAGMLKEKDAKLAAASHEEGGAKNEFSLVKGFAVAIFAGVMSSGMAISIDYGKPIAEAARVVAVDNMGITHETATLFQNSAILIVTLLGGFIVNFAWCFFLCYKGGANADFKTAGMSKNLLFTVLCALGSFLWYCQFFLYGMARTKLPEAFQFASWAILMACVIIFAGVIGLLIGEWKGTTSKTKGVLWAGLIVLGISTILMNMA